MQGLMPACLALVGADRKVRAPLRPTHLGAAMSAFRLPWIETT